MPLSQKCHDTDGQDPAVSWHSGATRFGLASISHCHKLALVFLFSKSLKTRSGRVLKNAKALEAVALNGTDRNKEKGQ
jgi:hypothetical protein